MIEIYGKNYRCEIDFFVNMISGKWKVDIICYLSVKKVLRFNEIRRLIPNITHKILSQQLYELEFNKIVSRKVYAEVPPKVEYRLTESGNNLASLFKPMIDWSILHIDMLKELELLENLKEL